jgi:hypothetical protein
VAVWEGTGPNAPWPETYDPHDEDHVASPGEDYTTPYDHELWAVWSGHLDTPAKFAHEFGHLLGFADDDRQSGLPIPGRQGTLMDGGDRVDEALANRLADLARHADPKVPECETWTGTYSGTITFDCNVLGVKSGTMDGQFTIKVDASGVATLEGTNTTSASCGPEVTATTPVTLIGSRTPTGFEFPSLWGIPLTITVSGDRGTGAISEAGPGLGLTTLTADITFSVERTDPAAE